MPGRCGLSAIFFWDGGHAIKLRLGIEELWLGIGNFARDIERGASLLMIAGAGAMVYMLVTAVLVLGPLELLWGRVSNDWYSLLYIAGAIGGIRFLGIGAQQAIDEAVLERLWKEEKRKEEEWYNNLPQETKTILRLKRPGDN